MMRSYLFAYGAALVTLLVCDSVWLATVGVGIYRPRLGDLLLERPVYWAAGAFYLLYAVGVVVFAVAPGLRAESWSRALVLGAFFGIVAYATYDLTNLATVRGWSLLVAMLDIGWGGVLSGVAATVACLVALRALP